MANPSLVRCPYWHKDEPRKIICEGLTDGETMHRIFESGVDKRRVKEGLCCNRWRECPIAACLNKKYDY